MCFKSRPSSQCPICLENKQLTTQCKICTDTRICKDCCLSLCEKGLCSKCPVCRQPNWKKPKKSQVMPILPKIKVIFPSKTEEPEPEPDPAEYSLPAPPIYWIDECIRCKNIIFNIMVAFASCMLIYVLGLFTVFIFAGDAMKNNIHLYWVAAIVGLGWVALVWSPCCCGKTLRNIYCTRETY